MTPDRAGHLADGYCDSISSTQAWCNYPAAADHAYHRCPYMLPSSRTIDLFWTDEDPHPRRSEQASDAMLSWKPPKPPKSK